MPTPPPTSPLASDRLAEICRKRPDRFAGLGSFAPPSPKRAAKEIARAIGELKLGGLIVNSHTNGDYFDDPRCWPILEAAEAHDACIYIHPRAPSDTLKGPLQDYAMGSAMWLRRGGGHAHAADDGGRRVRPLPQGSRSASATWARWAARP